MLHGIAFNGSPAHPGGSGTALTMQQPEGFAGIFGIVMGVVIGENDIEGNVHIQCPGFDVTFE